MPRPSGTSGSGGGGGRVALHSLPFSGANQLPAGRAGARGASARAASKQAAGAADSEVRGGALHGPGLVSWRRLLSPLRRRPAVDSINAPLTCARSLSLSLSRARGRRAQERRAAEARARERQALHELMRLGLGRAEDARLLQKARAPFSFFPL